MEFDVYCDESGIEALYDKKAHLYSAIGGVWMPAIIREQLKDEVRALKAKYSIEKEFKWVKVSSETIEFYKEVVNVFFTNENLRFRAILIETNKVDNIRFNNADNELGYYKFYYQLLHHWISDFNTYNIFLDLKKNRVRTRLKKLKEVLGCSNLTSSITKVQGLPSEELVGIQLADLLTGLVASKFNKEATNTAKLSLIQHVEDVFLKKAIKHCPPWEEKFNVFLINLQGGW